MIENKETIDLTEGVCIVVCGCLFSASMTDLNTLLEIGVAGFQCRVRKVCCSATVSSILLFQLFG